MLAMGEDSQSAMIVLYTGGGTTEAGKSDLRGCLFHLHPLVQKHGELNVPSDIQLVHKSRISGLIANIYKTLKKRNPVAQNQLGSWSHGCIEFYFQNHYLY